MGTLDILLLIFLGIGAFKGYSNGFIVELFSIIAFFVGLFLALELTIPVTVKFFGGSDYFDIISILVFIGLFILLSFVIRAGAKLIKKAIDFTPFGILDNVVGAISGAFKIVLILSIINWICSSVGIDFSDSYARDSIIFPYIVVIGPAAFEALGHLIPVIKDLIDSMDNIPRTKDTLITVLT